jgi:hypothetical protein
MSHSQEADMVNTSLDAQRAGGETDVSDLDPQLEQEGQTLSETLGDARDAVVTEAQVLGDLATTRLETEAEGVKDQAAAGLEAFSDALKAASKQLSGKQLGFAGDMVQQAAGGLETLARSLEGSSPREMLDSIRAFGRQNPVGFIAGSVLAGVALGRVAAAAPGRGSQVSSPTADPVEGPGVPTFGEPTPPMPGGADR